MKSRKPVKETFSTMGLFTTGLLAFSCKFVFHSSTICLKAENQQFVVLVLHY